MARIRTLSPASDNISFHKSDVDATFQVIADDADRTLFHLSTYGSKERKSGPKVSQTFQIDVNIARELVNELRRAFGDEVIS